MTLYNPKNPDAFKQEELKAPEPMPLNISPVPGGSVVEKGDLSSPNFREGRAGWRIRSTGDAEFNDAIVRGTIVIGGQYRTVNVGDSIQEAVNAVNAAGGGTVVLQSGTHTMASDLTLYSNIYLIGQNESTIIDFNSGNYSIKAIGSGAYTTGTVSVSNNGTTVTGSGTSWLANISAGQSILLSGIWYPITNVASDTSLTIAIPFADVALSGEAYTVATLISDVKLENFTVKNSTTSAIKFQYLYEGYLRDLNVQSSLVGVEIDDSSNISINQTDCTANYTNWDFNNVHFIEHTACGAVDALSGNGCTLNKVTNSAFTAFFILNSSADGINITDCKNSRIDGVFVSNGGSGVEFVSGNSNIVLHNNRVEANGADGVKLTATSDNIFIQSSFIKDNTGYGVNVAASSDDNCVITGNNFSGNTTSAVNDSGTGTVIRGNVGEADNGTSGSGTITKTYEAGQDLSSRDAVFIADGTQTFTLYNKSVTETTTSNLGSSSTNQRRATQLIPSSTITIDKIKMNFSKSGSPTDNLVIAIQADSSGDPSGVDLATASIAGTTLTTSQAAYTASLSSEITLTGSTTYWVVLRRSSSVDASNYYLSGVKVTGANKGYNGTSWSADNTDTNVEVIHTVTAGQILKARADTSTYYEGFIGLTMGAVSSGDNVMVTVGGEVTGLSGLTPSSQYYISNTPGAISTTPGSNTRKVGIATSATTLLITNIW